jgi:hypothetical protein
MYWESEIEDSFVLFNKAVNCHFDRSNIQYED